MDPLQGLTTLEARRRELLIESDLNRQVLRLELEQLRLRADGVRRNFGWLKTGWAWLAPVAGLLFARKLRQGSNPIAKGSLLLLLGRKAWNLWRHFQTRRERPPV